MTTTATPCFAVRGLVRSYPGRSPRKAVPAVLATDNVDLTIAQGQVYGLLGPNGAGKTTLVRQLIGLLTPDEGTVALFGHDVTGRPDLVSRQVAYLAQSEPALDELSVRAAVDTTGRLRGLPRSESGQETDRLVDELGLGGFADRPITKLSGGQRRLAGVATALVGDRPVLVLDEPTTGLDPEARRAVWEALHRRRTSGVDRGAGDAQRPRGRDRPGPRRGARPGAGHRRGHAGAAQGTGQRQGPARPGVAPRPAAGRSDRGHARRARHRRRQPLEHAAWTLARPARRSAG